MIPSLQAEAEIPFPASSISGTHGCNTFGFTKETHHTSLQKESGETGSERGSPLLVRSMLETACLRTCKAELLTQKSYQCYGRVLLANLRSQHSQLQHRGLPGGMVSSAQFYIMGLAIIPQNRALDLCFGLQPLSELPSLFSKFIFFLRSWVSFHYLQRHPQARYPWLCNFNLWITHTYVYHTWRLLSHHSNPALDLQNSPEGCILEISRVVLSACPQTRLRSMARQVCTYRAYFLASCSFVLWKWIIRREIKMLIFTTRRQGLTCLIKLKQRNYWANARRKLWFAAHALKACRHCVQLQSRRTDSKNVNEMPEFFRSLETAITLENICPLLTFAYLTSEYLFRKALCGKQNCPSLLK